MEMAVKIKICLNVGLSVITGIFCFFLYRYSMILREIRSHYENVLFQAICCVRNPKYFDYFAGGLILGIVLFHSIRHNWEKRYIDGLLSFVFMGVEVVLFLTLIFIFWDPVFTSILICMIAGYIVLKAGLVG